MNTQNISVLVEQLTTLGFENMGTALLKRIAFKPEEFSITRRIEKDRDLLIFHLFFTMSALPDTYSLMYYDAIFQKESPETFVNGVDMAAMRMELEAIDWKDGFDFTIIKPWNKEDEVDFIKAERIAKVMENLAQLEKTEAGKAEATNLKLKYWSGTNYQELFGNIVPARIKTEITQRFYFSMAHHAISVNEAYRFLQNKCLEKELKERKKETAAAVSEQQTEDAGVGSGGSLLQKKKINTAKKVKR